MTRTTMVALGLLASTLSVGAAPQPERVRGTIVSSNETSVTVKTPEGTDKTVMLTPTTRYLTLSKSSLENVTDGKFIGTATKGESPSIALEVSIFPASMKGTGEGHYDWDTIKDTTAGAKGSTKSAMTNGTVMSATGQGAMTKSAMTNGTVQTGSATGGGKTITVTYSNGKTLEVIVPPTAPIVEFQAADKSIVKPGETLFSITKKEGDTLTAMAVTIGKDGVRPPM